LPPVLITAYMFLALLLHVQMNRALYVNLLH